MPGKVHISRAQIDQFTSIVRLPPGCSITSSWLEEQQQAILDLQPSLLKPKNLAIRMIERFSNDRAELCYQHRKLNPLVIRKLFEYIQLECTTRMMPFEISPTAPNDLAIQQWRKRVIGINSLWTEKETFYHVHQAKEGDPINQQIKGDCEACILATIGGNQQMLKDLYICANSRGRLDRRGQPICHMIEGWLDAMGILKHIYETMKPFYRLIRSERARMQRERRAERRVNNRGRPSTAPERLPRPKERQTMEDNAAAEDEKSDIIDLYITRLSAMNGQDHYNKQPNDNSLSLHPAIRSHIGFNAATGKYSRANPDDVPPTPQSLPEHQEHAWLERSNTAISRDSRNDPGAYEVFRSDCPVSDDSRNNSLDRNFYRKKSTNDYQYSESSYSRPSTDQQPYDSGYQESSSILSSRERDHELNLRMNPTNADIGCPHPPVSPEVVKKKGYWKDPPAADVQRNRQDAYSNLVGMPSAYEFTVTQQKLKALYEFQHLSENKGNLEDKSLQETKTDSHQNRLVNAQVNERRPKHRGSIRHKRPATGTSRSEHDSKADDRKQGEDIQGAHERRNTDWGDFCRLSLEDDKTAVSNQ